MAREQDAIRKGLGAGPGEAGADAGSTIGNFACNRTCLARDDRARFNHSLG
jgi:hypothetical protein